MTRPIVTLLPVNDAQDEKQPQPEPPQEQRPGSASPAPDAPYDPIENALRRHPGLTREKAEEMAESFGF